jgi:hypothetical protein
MEGHQPAEVSQRQTHPAQEAPGWDFLVLKGQVKGIQHTGIIWAAPPGVKIAARTPPAQRVPTLGAHTFAPLTVCKVCALAFRQTRPSVDRWSGGA